MQIGTTPRRKGLPTFLLYAAVTALFLLLAARWTRSLSQAGDVTWGDARVYARSIATWQAGGDPYAISPGSLLFVYPPIFLEAGSALHSVLPGQSGWYLYLSLNAIALLSVPWLQAAGYIRSHWLSPPVAMAIFTLQPRFIESLMLLSGNISNIAYALALATGILGLRRNRWLPYCAVVGLAALAKPPFLALLLLPLLQGGRRQLASIGSCIAAVAAAYALQRVLMPQAYAAFERAVYAEIVGREDAGFGFFNYLLKPLHRLAPSHAASMASACALAIAALLFAALYLLRRRTMPSPMSDLWVPAVLVAAVVANPRMQRYDADIAIIPALYLCIEFFIRIPRTKQLVALAAIAFTCAEAAFAKSAELGVFLLLLASLAAFMVLQIQLPGTASGNSEFTRTEESFGA